MRKTLASAVFITSIIAFSTSPAAATGTAVIVHPDGTKTDYHNVRIAIRDESMAITSPDGKGMLVLGKAACTKVGELVRCLPYDATLLQNGVSLHIRLQEGTVWLNPTGNRQPMSYSSTELLPHGVELAFRTMRGTYVTLTGVVDEVQR